MTQSPTATSPKRVASASPPVASTPATSTPAASPKPVAAKSPSAASPGRRTASKSPPAASFPWQHVPPQNAPLIEAEHEVDSLYDGDSGIGTLIGTDTTSLASSILHYRFENGRTYHSYKEGSYILPNDERESSRLDLQHHACLLTMDNKLFLSPADQQPLRRVFDAGTGTGIWALEFADEHPECDVLGVDLSPIQPDFVPQNVHFLVDDLEADWDYQTPFDLVYMRMLSASIDDWDRLFGQARDNLRPGGWIELCDPVYPLISDDGSLPEYSALNKWGVLMNEAPKKIGRSLDTALAYKEQLTRAGFINVTEVCYKWPVNTWPKDPAFKELGAWTHQNLLDGAEALSLALFTRNLGWTAEQVRDFLKDVVQDLRKTSYHAYLRLYVVYGQKPEF